MSKKKSKYSLFVCVQKNWTYKNKIIKKNRQVEKNKSNVPI